MLKDGKARIDRNRYKKRFEIITSLLQALEYSIVESQHSDREILMAVRLDNLKNHSMKIKMEELEEENRQLLHGRKFHEMEAFFKRKSKGYEPKKSKVFTRNDIVKCLKNASDEEHLLHRYEELLANHNGLLKILGLRISDVRKYQEENAKLRQDVEKLKASLEGHKYNISELLEKHRELKYRKNNKIMRLKNDRNTLAIIHNRLVNLLQKQCMEQDDVLHRAVKETSKSERAVLLQEIRKNNILSYEKFQLQQENEYLQSILNVKKSSCGETVSL